MVGLTLLFILFVLIIGIPIWFFLAERRKINSLAVGQRFVSSFREADPWADERDVYTILEIKNGWVKAKMGDYPMRAESAKQWVEFKVKISD